MNFNTFQDLFTRDEIRLLAEVKDTGYSAIFPVLLRAPMQTGHTWTDNRNHEQGKAVTLRLYYATQVWSHVYAIMSERHSRSSNPLNEYVWDNWNESFRIIRFVKANHAEIVKEFWAELERVSNSGKITVSEGVHRWFERKENWQWKADDYNKTLGLFSRMLVVVDIKDMSENRGYSQDYEKKISGVTNKTYLWDEIKDLFVQLPEKLLSCLDEKRMHRHKPADIPLFEACDKLDIEGVKQAVANGANVNALNESGASPMMVACDALHNAFLDAISAKESPGSPLSDSTANLDKHTAASKTIITCLLENGAKIDLCGGCDGNPLYTSHYFTDADLMRFLLDLGANPNVNCWLTDHGSEWYTASSVLDGVWSDQSCYGDSPQLTEKEHLLLEHGARLYINGLDAEKQWGKRDDPTDRDIADYIAQIEAKYPALDARLVIACSKLSVGGILNALSAGANIKLRDSQGRRLLSIAIEEGRTIGQPFFQWRCEQCRIPPNERPAAFEEHMLTAVICLVGQDKTLLAEDGLRAIKACGEHGFLKIKDYLVKKGAASTSPISASD